MTGMEVPQAQMTAVVACEVEVKYRVADLGALEAALAARGIVLSAPVLVDGGECNEHVQEEMHRFATTLEVPLTRTTDTYDSLIRAAQTLS